MIFFYPLIINLNYLKHFLLGVSLVVVLILGTVNHPNMQLDEIELSLCKKAARKMAVVEVIVIIISCFLGVDKFRGHVSNYTSFSIAAEVKG